MRRIFWLFARSRTVVPSLATIVVVNLGGLALTTAQIERPGSESGIPWVMFLPYLSACVIGLSMGSPLDEFDRMAARPLWPLRLAQIVVLVAPAMALVVLVASSLEGAITQFSAARNLVGLVGLSLITGRLAGSRLSWVPGLLLCITAATLGDPRSTLPAWDWLVRTDSDYQAAVVAWALGFVGLMAGLAGTREFRWTSTEPIGAR